MSDSEFPDLQITKDPYLLIAEQADDRTILMMMSVNKYFYNDKFFETLMQKRYPFLAEFKRHNEPWRHFYIRMIHYISRIKEEFDIQYIPSPEFHPVQFYYSTKQHLKWGINEGLRLAAGIGDRKLVDYFISRGAIDLNWALRKAASGGHKDLVIYLIEKGATDLDGALPGAAYKGNTDIIRYLLSRGATDLSIALYYAAYGGHKDLVIYLIDQEGATDVNRALYGATIQGQKDIVGLLKRYGAN